MYNLSFIIIEINFDSSCILISCVPMKNSVFTIEAQKAPVLCFLVFCSENLINSILSQNLTHVIHFSQMQLGYKSFLFIWMQTLVKFLWL